MTLRRIADDIAFCILFFTRLPLPGPHFGIRRLGDAIWAAPVAGLAVGLAGALVYAAAAWLGVPFPVAAALALAATMIASGCLHEDGLSDVADGFGGGKTRERRLEIMRDSRIGTYGTVALLLSVLIRWTAITSLAGPSLVFWILLAAHAASRAVLPAFLTALPPARNDGLGAGTGAVTSEKALVALAIGAVAVLISAGFWALVVISVLLAIFFYGFRALCMRQIGGQTGDTLGALQQTAEIGVLVVAAALLA